MKSISPPPNKTEKDILDEIECHFRARGYDIILQMRIRTWKPDMVALKGKELVIIEARGSLGDIDRALAQAAVYTTDATHAYIAIPEGRLTEDLKQKASVLGIGVLTVNDDVRTAVQPQRTSPRPSLLRRVQATLEEVPSTPERKPPRGRIPYSRFLKHREVLDVIFSVPGRRFTIRELSKEAGSSYATTWRLVNALVSLGALRSERVGPSRLISVNEESPALMDLKQLREINLLPHRKVAERFAELAGKLPNVQKVILFGSVAEGRARVDSDVDVAVVLRRKSEGTMRRVRDIATEIQDSTGITLVPIQVSKKELESGDELAQSLKEGVVLYERA